VQLMGRKLWLVMREISLRPLHSMCSWRILFSSAWVAGLVLWMATAHLLAGARRPGRGEKSTGPVNGDRSGQQDSSNFTAVRVTGCPSSFTPAAGS
jgi:hypothetical protein